MIPLEQKVVSLITIRWLLQHDDILPTILQYFLRSENSKFASLRSLHVQLSNKLPYNVCLCKYHENCILGINALNAHCPNIPSYNNELPEKLLCSRASRHCWFNNCKNCKDGKVFTTMTDMDDAAKVTWYVWKNDSGVRLSKVVEEGTTDDLRTYISSILPQFMEHCYSKREQAAAYKLEWEATEGSENKALLQVDFSENYTCQYQDEIQTTHWQQHEQREPFYSSPVAYWHAPLDCDSIR